MEQPIRVTAMVKEMMEFDVPFDDVIEALREYPLLDRLDYTAQIINSLSEDYRIGVDKLEAKQVDVIIDWCERTVLEFKQFIKQQS